MVWTIFLEKQIIFVKSFLHRILKESGAASLKLLAYDCVRSDKWGIHQNHDDAKLPKWCHDKSGAPYIIKSHKRNECFSVFSGGLHFELHLIFAV